MSDAGVKSIVRRSYSCHHLLHQWTSMMQPPPEDVSACTHSSVYVHLCVRALGPVLHSNSVSFSTCAYERGREREQPIPMLCLCVNLCNRILNSSSFSPPSLSLSLLSFFPQFFSSRFCLYRLTALFFRSIQTVAAPPPSPPLPRFSRSVVYTHSNMKIYSSILLLDDDDDEARNIKQKRSDGGDDDDENSIFFFKS